MQPVHLKGFYETVSSLTAREQLNSAADIWEQIYEWDI
jgi:hypothetical protein